MRLFVANLNKNVTENRLRQLFAKYGQVGDAEIWTALEFGKSRGFGLIEVEDKFDAELAVVELNGKRWRGRHLRVSEARKQGC